ncbi:MAG: hypothetical protein HC770_11595 [Pseudanabaena sp. CRU_2_10]|nr:hypothetical protein [Pseudanabaena sp. CRU_2_10]
MGKKVFIQSQNKLVGVKCVVRGESYTNEFEQLWAEISDPRSGDVYLDGTDESIQELLSPKWEVVSCARCEMPIPIGMGPQAAQICPCNNFGCYPNLEAIAPREPVITAKHLSSIMSRLKQVACSDR